MKRWAELHGQREVSDLLYGMDFRKPIFRREVFHRFYEFHLRYRTHPGLVYLIIPHLAETQGWTEEQALWFCFLNGNTQHAITSFAIMQRFPTVQSAVPSKVDQLLNEHHAKLDFDTDRRHFKRRLSATISQYRELLRGGTQRAFFERLYEGAKDDGERFMKVWGFLLPNLKYFGRLSVFSYMEYLRIAGLPLECPTLFLYDLDGSKSHRNGLCKVLGRDDLDWHDSNPEGFNGKYPAGVLPWLEQEGGLLLTEAQLRARGQPWERDVGYFTMESALCTYKSWHRINRRYPNVYADMMLGRIESMEKKWPREVTEPFRELRERHLPKHLRLECNPGDPGVRPEKQNHYLRTGQPIMMDVEWPCFRNDFNDAVRTRQGATT